MHKLNIGTKYADKNWECIRILNYTRMNFVEPK
jgi:hypothetical protein